MDHKRSFYNNQLGWEASSEDASLRLESRQESYVANNFYRKVNGRWEEVDEQELNAEERGLVWQVWRTAVSDKAFLAFRGVRAVDKQIAKLLEGVRLYNEEAKEYENAENAGHFFLLDGEGAKSFSERLASAGGRVVKSSPVSEESRGAVDEASLTLARIKDLVRADGQIVQRAETGDLSRLGELEKSQSEFSALIKKLEDLAGKAILDARPLVANDKSPVEREEGQAMIDEAERVIDEARMLAEVRQELVDSTATDEVSRGEISYGGRMLLYREMAHLARQDGLEVETSDEGVRIKVGKRWINLGEKIELSGQ